MKTVKITFNPPEIKSISFLNTFKQKPGQALKLAIRTQVSVKTNPAAPTTAMILVKITADDEDKNLTLELETLTLAASSTFIDNFDDIIKKDYLPVVMLAINEKVRSVTASLGLNLRLPSPQLEHTRDAEPEGPVYYS